MKHHGRVRLRLLGLGAEKLINTLWEKGVEVHGLRRIKKRGVELEAAEKHRRVIEAVAAEKGFQVTVLNAGWREKIKCTLKKRGALVAGLVLGAVLCAVSLKYVWCIRVEEAGKYRGEVALFLAEKGLRPGLPMAEVDTNALQEELMWRLPMVKWVWVKKEGVALVIRLEEGTAAGQVQGNAGDIIAGQDGVLVRLTVFAGTPVCKAGDAVRQGQVLIRGEEEGPDGTMIPVQARGQAVANVQVQKSVRLPTRELVSVPTGRTAERILYQTPFGTYTFEKEPDFLMADRLYTALPVPGVWLPVTVIRESFLECSGEWTERNPEEVMAEGQKAAEEGLIRTWPEGQNVDKSVKFSMIERGTVEVTASAVLTMDIAQFGTTP